MWSFDKSGVSDWRIWSFGGGLGKGCTEQHLRFFFFKKGALKSSWIVIHGGNQILLTLDGDSWLKVRASVIFQKQPIFKAVQLFFSFPKTEMASWVHFSSSMNPGRTECQTGETFQLPGKVLLNFSHGFWISNVLVFPGTTMPVILFFFFLVASQFLITTFFILKKDTLNQTKTNKQKTCSAARFANPWNRWRCCYICKVPYENSCFVPGSNHIHAESKEAETKTRKLCVAQKRTVWQEFLPLPKTQIKHDEKASEISFFVYCFLCKFSGAGFIIIILEYSIKHHIYNRIVIILTNSVREGCCKSSNPCYLFTSILYHLSILSLG